MITTQLQELKEDRAYFDNPDQQISLDFSFPEKNSENIFD